MKRTPDREHRVEDLLGRWAAFSHGLAMAQPPLIRPARPVRRARPTTSLLTLGGAFVVLSAAIIALATVWPSPPLPAGSAFESASFAGVGESGAPSPVPSSSPVPRESEPTPPALEASAWQQVVWSMALPKLGQGGNVAAWSVFAWRAGYIVLGARSDGSQRGAFGAWSSDGLVWQPSEGVEASLAAGQAQSFLETPRGLMALVATDVGTEVWITETGRRWEPQQSVATAFAGVRVYAVEAVPGGFLAFGRPSDSEASRVWRSVDGRVWSPEPQVEAHFSAYSDLRIQAVPSGFVALAREAESRDPGGDPPAEHSWWSADLAEWEPIEPYGDGRGLVSLKVTADGVLGVVNTACWGCVNRPDYWHSTDGRAWTDIQETDRPFASPESGLADEITVVQGTFVAVPTDLINDPDVLVSRDGLDWRRVDGVLTGDLDLSRGLPTFDTVAADTNGIVGAGIRRSQTASETDRGSALWIGHAREDSLGDPQDAGPVTVELAQPVGPNDTQAALLVSERGCHGYASELGRTVTEIDYGEEAVVIRVGVMALPGDCPGTVPTEVVIPLTEPIGERRLDVTSFED
ncbi:MAG: hypothetical protein H0V12_05175 [Chloroflexi bacterium]|nr:hypothetical protein [Chloroflexota bacterium]